MHQFSGPGRRLSFSFDLKHVHSLKKVIDKIFIKIWISVPPTKQTEYNKTRIQNIFLLTSLPHMFKTMVEHRVTHKEEYCKDDLKLLKYDESKVKINPEYSIFMAYVMIWEGKETILQLQEIIKMRQQTE